MTDRQEPQQRGLVTVVALALLGVPMGYSAVAVLTPGGAAEAADVFLERPAAKHTRCIDDTEYMRFHHMDVIKEIRDAGVRGGAIRTISLSSCRGCHTSRKRFCTRCHQAVNLTPDCFECHYYP